MALNGQKKQEQDFFCAEGKNALGRSPPQELKEGPRTVPYLLIEIKDKLNILEKLVSEMAHKILGLETKLNNMKSL